MERTSEHTAYLNGGVGKGQALGSLPLRHLMSPDLLIRLESSTRVCLLNAVASCRFFLSDRDFHADGIDWSEAETCARRLVAGTDLPLA